MHEMDFLTWVLVVDSKLVFLNEFLNSLLVESSSVRLLELPLPPSLRHEFVLSRLVDKKPCHRRTKFVLDDREVADDVPQSKGNFFFLVASEVVVVEINLHELWSGLAFEWVFQQQLFCMVIVQEDLIEEMNQVVLISVKLAKSTEPQLPVETGLMRHHHCWSSH